MSSAKPSKWCKGCIHNIQIGSDYGCGYIFNKGHMRPCDPGKDCTVKETRKRGRKKEKRNG